MESCSRLLGAPQPPPHQSWPPLQQGDLPPSAQSEREVYSFFVSQDVLHFQYLAPTPLTLVVCSWALSPSPTRRVTVCSKTWEESPVNLPCNRADLSFSPSSTWGRSDHCRQSWLKYYDNIVIFTCNTYMLVIASMYGPKAVMRH